MYTLGIETSCDETSAAVVENGRDIIYQVTASSLKWHRRYGGIVPEIASRKQLEIITQVVEGAMRGAGVRLKDIGLLSVTSGPGLSGSLLVGISFAKAVSLSSGIPLVGVNHLHGHIYAAFLSRMRARLPFVALVVSGGHTSLFLVKDFDKIKLLGATQDDACGEAFDKVAKVLKLGYPGGPQIERLSKKGNPKKITFRCSGTQGPFDFSFSGIKTAVLYSTNRSSAGLRFNKEDIAASFQDAVIDSLVRKALSACKAQGTRLLAVGGGVVANRRLREKFCQAARDEDIELRFPQLGLCMDNAAMVAGLGYRLFKKGYRSGLNLNLNSN